MTVRTTRAHSVASDHAVLAYCRPGFELECATEIAACADELAISGKPHHEPKSGYVLWRGNDAEHTEQLFRQLDFSVLVFARAWFLVVARCDALPQHNRVGPLVARAAEMKLHGADVVVETPDSDATKPLVPLCRGIAAPLRKALHDADVLAAKNAPTQRLHVCFLGTDCALLGWSDVRNASEWPMGIPRLKASPNAPSRSAMKLEEALVQFDAARHLKPGMTAVDLGAAPGGWTWILTQHHMRVTAVDNGAMHRSLSETGLVNHRREDGFRFRPKQRVDWMVCDMVEKPRRIAALLAQWLTQGWCSRAIVNLKLPMKKRYDEVATCLQHIEEQANGAGLRLELRAKQLYHDREEITLYAAVVRGRQH